MDTEKSSSSSFEDLCNLNETDTKTVSSTMLIGETGVQIKSDQPKEQSGMGVNDPKIEGDLNAAIESAGEICDVLGNGQLTKRVIKKSKSGKRPARGELVTISYIGKLYDSELTVEKVDYKQIHVGDYEVVQGLDMTIPLMDVGEVAEIVVNSRFAYGALGLKNEHNSELSIPPNATIKYEINLLDSKYEELDDLKHFEIRKRYGNAKRERANFWYNRNEYNTAIQLYRRALEYLDDRDGDPGINFPNSEDIELSNSDLQSLLDDRLVVYNNLAMAQIKISAYDAALTAVEHVLRCQPNNAKALYRRGRILEAKGDTKGAITFLQKAATLEPDTKSIQQDLAKLIIKARREEHNEKKMYQKMLGQANKLEQKNQRTQKQQSSESSKLKILGYMMGSVLIGVAGVAIYRYKY